MKNQRLTKQVIKEIVKECLIEVLAEGLASAPQPSRKKQYSSKKSPLKETLINHTRSTNSNSKKMKQKTSHLDSISFGEDREERRPNSRLDEIARSATSDPILSEMLADTAHTTLQEQIAAESKKGYVSPSSGDNAQKTVSTSTPEDLFGEEASGKWAQLAFGG